MNFKIISSENIGVFLTNPSLQTLREAKEDERVLAKITYVVTDDHGQEIYTIVVEEYFADKLTEIKTPSAEDPHGYEFHTEPGPLQTKIIINCPGTAEEAKKKLDNLNKYLAKGFYVQHPYAAILGVFCCIDEKPYMQISGITPLFADTIWDALQSCPEFSVPTELITELQAHTYPYACVASEEQNYSEIQKLIAEGKYNEAVDFAHNLAIAPTDHGTPSMTSDYLYQTGLWLKDKSTAEANRAFRLLSGMESHCMHLLARSQLAEVAAEKLSNPMLYGAQRMAWSRNMIDTGARSATTPGANQDAFIDAFKTLATQDGAIEMSGTPGGEEYAVAVNAALERLKGREFNGSALDDTIYGDMVTSGEIELGFAMMDAILEGMGAAIRAVQPEPNASSKSGAKPRPKPGS